MSEYQSDEEAEDQSRWFIETAKIQGWYTDEIQEEEDAYMQSRAHDEEDDSGR